MSYTHPKGVYFLGFVSLWERFGFYAVQSVLVLFLIQQFHFSDTKAYAIYSVVTSLMFASPLLGGVITDRFLNRRAAILFGLGLSIVGYLLLTIYSLPLFYLAFAIMILGNAYVKGNLSAQLGAQYPAKDARVDSGFTMYYLFMNVGHIAGPLVAALAMKYIGFNAAFIAAGVALVLCFMSYSQGKKYLVSHVKVNTTNRYSIVLLLSLIALLVINVLLKQETLLEWIVVFAAVISSLLLIYFFMAMPSATGRYHITLLSLMLMCSIIYWAIWMQMFTSLTLFIDRNVDKHILGWDMPTAMLVAFEGLGIVLLGPLFAKLWLKLNQSRYQLTDLGKFLLGFSFTLTSFVLLIVGIHWFNVGGYISIGWAIVALLLIAAGELCISPIGLSAISRFAPERHINMIMGMWFLTTAIGVMLAGKLATLSSISKVSEAGVSLNIYDHAFHEYIALIIGAMVVIGIVKWVIRSKS